MEDAVQPVEGLNHGVFGAPPPLGEDDLPSRGRPQRRDEARDVFRRVLAIAVHDDDGGRLEALECGGQPDRDCALMSEVAPER